MRAFKIGVTLLVVLGLAHEAQAQFQKKFTIDVGVSPLFPSQEALREDRNPYLFSNFQYGYGTYTNLLYNLSKKFSVGAAVNLSSFRSWQDPRTSGSGDNSYFNIYSMDANLKYKVISKRISPFVLGGAGLSVYHAKRAQTQILVSDFYKVDFPAIDDDGGFDYVSIDDVLIREPGFEVKPRSAFHLMGAVGLDIKLSESIGLTFMACYNISFTSGISVLDQNMKYLSFPVGVNLSLGKSKTL